jgi:hypothetical protein
VHTAWDLGVSDSTAIWFFQVSRAEVRVIDYYEASGYGLPHYAAVLTSRGYNYGTDYLPHDAQARQLGTGRSLWETLHSLTNRIPRVLAQQNLMDGINAARISIASCWFDTYKCHDGLEALRAYRADYDDKRKAFTDRPRHDWASHGCLHGNTILLTRHGTCRIMDLPETGEVATPCGWQPYQYPRITLTNAQLVEVAFSDGHTVKCTPDHLFLTDNGWKSASSLLPGSVIQSTLTPSTNISMVASTAYGRVRDIMRAVASGCIAMSGAMLSDLSRRVATSIIGTLTPPTTTSPIWNAFPHPSICPALGTPSLQACRSAAAISASWRVTRQRNGISPKRAVSGTDVMRYEPRDGRSGSDRLSPVVSAASRLKQLFARLGLQENIAATTVKPLTIVSVRHLSERADVWDITVPGPECFALANGAVVHNSDAFRYLGLAWRQMQPEKPPKPPEDSWDRAFARASQSTVESWRVA